jgi:SAM-dependent methyltransferase
MRFASCLYADTPTRRYDVFVVAAFCLILSFLVPGMKSELQPNAEDPAAISSAWFADESFWEVSFEFMFPDESFAQAEEQVGHFSELTGSSFSRVLDLCCGPDRHSIPLARRGALVTGVDRTSFLLKNARDRAESESLDIEWIQQDMRTFVRPGKFDLATSLFTSFGYFDKEEENLTVLRNVRSSLVPGGFFIVDVLGKEVLARRFAPSAMDELSDGTIMVQRREIVADWSRTKATWLFIKNNQVTRWDVNTALYSGQELAKLLRTAGFADVRLYGTWNGAPYDLNAERLIAVAGKGT